MRPDPQITFAIAGDLFGRRVEGEDVTLQISCNQSRANRFDYSLVKRAKVCERLSCS